jgi:transcriptional regulator with XRE-family HTH domain
MASEPPVLERLKALGLDQKTIAQFLGASPASVSMWCMGKTAFEEPWLTEATVLVAVLQEHLESGGTLATFRQEPGLVLSAGVAHPLGQLHVPPAQAADFFKTQDVIKDLPPHAQGVATAGALVKIAAGVIGAWAELIDPLTWQPTARELDALRRTVIFLQDGLTGQLRSMATTARPEDPHAHETP